jgi:hypothetical protein
MFSYRVLLKNVDEEISRGRCQVFYSFRWIEMGKKIAFDERVKQMLISACRI